MGLGMYIFAFFFGFWGGGGGATGLFTVGRISVSRVWEDEGMEGRDYILLDLISVIL